MSVNLGKGRKINLSKEFAGVSKYHIGLGWDVNRYDGGDYDLDAMAFMITANGKVINDNYMVFYGSQTKDEQGRSCDPEKSLIHTGDNRTGSGDGDDEVLILDTALVNPQIEKIVIAVNIFNENPSNVITFGQVENAFIRICNEATGEELVRTDLSEDYDAETALVFAEFYRHNGDWKYTPVCQGYKDGLVALCNSYGIDAEFRG